jgi:hypothetical protein
VVGAWRRLHAEELHNLRASPNINRVICRTKEDEMDEAYSTHGWDE